jgi:hypothetical protein
MPSLIGIVAEQHGIQAGIRILAAASVVLLILAIVNKCAEKNWEPV